MPVTPVSQVALRVDLPTSQSGAALDLPRDRPLTVTVLGVSRPGRWLVDVAGQRVTAVTDLNLSVGDQLEVVATPHQGSLELRLVGMTTRFDQARYDAATLAQAGAAAGPVTLHPVSERLLALLHALFDQAATVPLDDVELTALATALASRLRTLDPRRGELAVAEHLQQQIEEGGLLLEPRLKQWLESGGARGAETAGETAAPPQARHADLRALLAALDRQLLAFSNGTAAPLADAVRCELSRLASKTLAQQLDLALQWLRTGELHLQIPVAMSDQVRVAELRIRRRRSTARDGRRSAPGHAFDVRLDLAELGRLLARVNMIGTSLTVSLQIERRELAELAEAHIAGLSAGLKNAGFADVETRILVAPPRVEDDHGHPGEDPTTGGSIFRARV